MKFYTFSRRNRQIALAEGAALDWRAEIEYTPPMRESFFHDSGRVLAEEGGSITVAANAKVNLSLEILGRFEGGFHLLFSLICPLSLADRVRVTLLEPDAPRSVATTFGPELSAHLQAAIHHGALSEADISELSSPKNLAYRAAEILLANSRSGFSIEIEKHIPFGAGLGGGSSDAAAVLFALARLMTNPPDEAALLGAAAELGADVPAMLLRRVALMSGRGELLAAVSLPDPERLSTLSLLLVKPRNGVSTPEAYRLLGLEPRLSESAGLELARAKARQWPGISRLGLRIHNETWADNRLTLLPQEGISEHPELGAFNGPEGGRTHEDWLSLFENDFQRVVLGEFPEVREAAAELSRAGAQRTLLCGSGSALLGFFPDNQSRDCALERLRDLSLGWFLVPVTLVPNS